MRWMGLVRNVMLGREGRDRELLLRLTRDADGADPRSFLTTGNLTFSTGPDQFEGVVAALEAGIEGVLGRHDVVVVRPIRWLGELVDADSFRGYDPEDYEPQPGPGPRCSASTPVTPAEGPDAGTSRRPVAPVRRGRRRPAGRGPRYRTIR